MKNEEPFIKRLINSITYPKRIFLYLLFKFKYYIPDKTFLKIKYRLKMGKRLNIKNPKSFSEKLQWLKLYYHNPEYTKMVDKALAKEYVSNVIGEEYIVPLLGCWNKFDNIDFDSLPNQFVLKTTHGCGGIIICKNKNELNKVEAKKIIEKSLRDNYFIYGREWPYKNVIPKIIAEKFLVDDSGVGLKDYKFFCFDGEPKAMFIATDRGIDTRFNFYDIDFNLLPFTNGYKNSDKTISKPKNYDLMVDLSKKISKGIPHVRVDFYNVDGKIYFGEMTFFHWGGMMPFEPEEWDYIFGSWLNLPDKMV